MSLYVEIKSVYGNNLIYPACEKSRDFLSALGLKTFTNSALRAVKILGFKIETKHTPVEL